MVNKEDDHVTVGTHVVHGHHVSVSGHDVAFLGNGNAVNFEPTQGTCKGACGDNQRYENPTEMHLTFSLFVDPSYWNVVDE